MNIQIRRLKEEDIQQVLQFFRMVSIDTYERNNITNYEEAIEDELLTKGRYLQQDVDSNGRERHFLVAFDGDKVVGTIGLYIANHVAVKLTQGEVEGIYEVGTIYIAPDYQRLGIGKLLLKSMMFVLHARQIGKFCLDTGFATAQEVWLHILGEPTYLFEHHWGDGAHHMIWLRNTDDVKIEFDIA